MERKCLALTSSFYSQRVWGRRRPEAAALPRDRLKPELEPWEGSLRSTMGRGICFRTDDTSTSSTQIPDGRIAAIGQLTAPSQPVLG